MKKHPKVEVESNQSKIINNEISSEGNRLTRGNC